MHETGIKLVHHYHVSLWHNTGTFNFTQENCDLHVKHLVLMPSLSGVKNLQNRIRNANHTFSGVSDVLNSV